MNRANRRGAVLIEVLVALAILATVGAGLLAVVAESVASIDRSHAADTTAAAASGYLDIIALWPREDLDRRLGVRINGPWRVTIQRDAPSLYAVTLADTLSGAIGLRTVLYRP